MRQPAQDASAFSTTHIQNIKQYTGTPITHRSNDQVSKLMDLLRKQQFFKDVAEQFGNNTFFEYCKVLQHMQLTANLTISSVKDQQDFKLLYSGVVTLVRTFDGQLVDQYSKGATLPFPENLSSDDLKLITKSDSFILHVRAASFRKLRAQEQNFKLKSQKKNDLIKNSQGLRYMDAKMRQCSFFANLPHYDVQELLMNSKVKTYKGGENIYENKKYAEYLFVVGDGKVQINHTFEVKDAVMNKYKVITKKVNREKAATQVANPGEIFGLEQVLRFENPYDSTAVAMVDSKLIAIPADLIRDTINLRLTRSFYNDLIVMLNKKRSILENSKFSNSNTLKSLQDIARGNGKNTLLPSLVEKINRSVMSKTLTPKQKDGNDPQSTLNSSQYNSFRSRKTENPYCCYLPSSLFHKSTVAQQFIGDYQDVDLGLIKIDPKKQHKYLQPFYLGHPLEQQQEFFKMNEAKPKKIHHVLQRTIIQRLESMESKMNSNPSIFGNRASSDRLYEDSIIDSEASRQGSTVNFFQPRMRGLNPLARESSYRLRDKSDSHKPSVRVLNINEQVRRSFKQSPRNQS